MLLELDFIAAYLRLESGWVYKLKTHTDCCCYGGCHLAAGGVHGAETGILISVKH